MRTPARDLALRSFILDYIYPSRSPPPLSFPLSPQGLPVLILSVWVLMKQLSREARKNLARRFSLIPKLRALNGRATISVDNVTRARADIRDAGN